MAMRYGAVAVAVVFCLISTRLEAAQTAPVANSYSDELQRLPPQERAKRLANYVGFSCIGSNPFLMGVTQTGAAEGYAYWSLECAGGESYVIQIDRSGEGAATDCRTLKEAGSGQQCFKKF